MAVLAALQLDTARLPAPRADGDREALRILLCARAELTTTATGQANRLRALLRDGLGAIGIVQVEQRGLHEHVGRAEACRVIGVALDLDRAAFATEGQDAHAVAVEWHGRRKVGGTARDDLGGLLGIGNQLPLGGFV